MTRRAFALLFALSCLAPGALATPAGASAMLRARGGATLGLTAPLNQQGFAVAQDVASGSSTPVTYHGGPVMTGQTILHAIFWAPAGYSYQGMGPGTLTYRDIVNQFFNDSTADSGRTTNVFSVLPQFEQGTTASTSHPACTTCPTRHRAAMTPIRTRPPANAPRRTGSPPA